MRRGAATVPNSLRSESSPAPIVGARLLVVETVPRAGLPGRMGMRARLHTLAAWHEGMKLAALEIDHVLRQPAVAENPPPDRVRIGLPQRARALDAGDRPAVAVRQPCGVETEPRAVRRAQAFARNNAEQERAGRQAVAVDHHAFARGGEHREVLQILS